MVPLDHVVVRYREGSGGETLTAALHSILNDDVALPTYVAPANRTFFEDVFHDTFHQRGPLPVVRERYGLPAAEWRTMSPDVIGGFVSQCYAAATDAIPVGKMHYCLTPEQMVAFPATTFIDLLPERRHAFVVAALLFRKVYLQPAYEVPHCPAHPQFEEVVRIYNRRGRIPFYWARCLQRGRNVHDLHGFVRHVLLRSVVLEERPRYPGSTHVIPATSFLLDPSLSSLRTLVNMWECTLPPALAVYVETWVERNNALIDEMNLRRLLPYNLPFEQQAVMISEALRQHEVL